jgi:hypothetical protein
VRASNANSRASLVAAKILSSKIEMPRMAAAFAAVPYRFSQMMSPVFPSSAWMTLPGLLR